MSAIQIETTETSKYALEINEVYDYPNTDPTIILKSCPSASELETVDNNNTTGGHTFTFETTLGEESFMSNALKFRFDIPINVTRSSDAGVAVTADTFMYEMFNNCNDICVSQYGLLQAIQSCTVSLNGTTINLPTDIPEAINILSQYYKSEDIAEWFPASQPDMFQNFDEYAGDKLKSLKFIDENSMEAYTCMSPVQENNIFGCRYTKGYMSRTPVFRFEGTGTNQLRECKVIASFFTYLPLSFGSVPDKVSSLIGIKRLAVKMVMKPDMIGHLFSAQTNGAGRVTMELDRTTATKAQMFVQRWSSPNGIALPRTENGLLPPYSIQVPDIQVHRGRTYTDVPYNVDQKFSVADVQCATVPKSIYIAIARRKKAGSFADLTQSPINYGLIKNLNVNVNSLKTTFNGVSELSYLADTNGYDAFTDTLGRLIKGFAVKLDLEKDLSINGVTCIGAAANFRVSIDGTFINQHSHATGQDYEVFVITSEPVSLDFDGAGFKHSSGVLIDGAKLMNSEFMRAISYNYGRRADVMGAGFWSGIKNIAKKAWNNRDAIAQHVGDAVALARTLRGGERAYNNVSGAGTPFMGAGSTSTTTFFPQGAGYSKGPEIFKRK